MILIPTNGLLLGPCIVIGVGYSLEAIKKPSLFSIVCALFGFSEFMIRYSICFRQARLKIMLALILIPLLVSTLKIVSHVYGPQELQHYGGTVPYVRICEAYPSTYSGPRNGRFFPVHASGGFALMALVFCLPSSRLPRAELCCSLFLGWLGGFHQIIREEHFLRHTLVSMLLAYAVCLCIDAAVPSLHVRKKASPIVFCHAYESLRFFERVATINFYAENVFLSLLRKKDKSALSKNLFFDRRYLTKSPQGVVSGVLFSRRIK